ncbi:extracellular solute-binding protein [Pendulispora brunnea]|uniref:Extracellular solute-binding protein n=1 Tax=Pendulispora brunnea TaxID=2905690 RepID=A0ABZ2KE19_9BACT
MMRARIGLFATMLLAVACGGAPQTSGSTDQALTGKRTLRVALYPFIPADIDGKEGFTKLRAMLEARFEEQNPDVDLVLAEMDPNAAEFYDRAKLAAWLRDVQDVVEIDTALMGDIAGELAEWNDPNRGDWHPAAREAVTYRGRSYGVPHLQCSHFVYTRDAAVVTAKTVTELAQRLEALPAPALGAPIRGTWTLPSLFLDAYEDRHPGASLAGVISRPGFPNARLVEGLASLVRTCAVGDTNPCLDATYDNPNVAMDDFAAKKTGAYIGFSESLHRILVQRKDTAPIFVTSAPLGEGSYPLLFTDALVRGKKCKGACARDAQAFADFLTSPATMELVMMGDDLDSGVPRYLLPATRSAYHSPRVKNDSTYRVLESLTRRAEPYPNRDIYEVVQDGTRAEQLLAQLKEAVATK